MTRTRRIILIIVLAFVIYAVYNDPTRSADYVRQFFQLIANAVNSVFSFFRAIMG